MTSDQYNNTNYYGTICAYDQCSVLFSKFAWMEKEDERARYLRERINGGWYGDKRYR
jgi:hypothetical protein